MSVEFLLGGSDSTLEVIVIEGRIDDGVARLLEKGGLGATWNRHPAVEEEEGHGASLPRFT
jgi:hypothetical protein